MPAHLLLNELVHITTIGFKGLRLYPTLAGKTRDSYHTNVALNWPLKPRFELGTSRRKANHNTTFLVQ
jgi:hypothetical protein